MADRGAQRMSPENLPLLLGVITIISGVATGLFADLRQPGQALGVAVFVLWMIVIGCLLWRPELASRIRWLTMLAFATTVVLVLFAVSTGPRLNDRTLVLSAQGAQIVKNACPGALSGRRAAAGVALPQLQDQFVHIELRTGGCADADVRLRAADLLAVLPQ